MIKIAFFDVDGTILPFGHKEPTEKTLYALKKLQENGVLLCMATGRSYPIVPHFKGLEFDIYMTFNGSYIRSGDTIIRSNPLSNHDVHQIVNNLKKMGKPCAVANEYVLRTNGSDYDLTEYFDFGGEELILAENFEQLINGDIYQIMSSCKKEEYEETLKGCDNAAITAWWDRAVDIIPKGGGKGIATKAVLDYYRFKKEEAIAFGDGGNDIEMLEAVGTGVAMGNAKEEVKKKATEVCGSVDEDGIYQYCIEHKLI